MRLEPTAVCRQAHARSVGILLACAYLINIGYHAPHGAAHAYTHVYRSTDSVASGKHIPATHSSRNCIKVQSGSSHALDFATYVRAVSSRKSRLLGGISPTCKGDHRTIDSFWGLASQHRDMTTTDGAVDVSGKIRAPGVLARNAHPLRRTPMRIRTHIHSLHSRKEIASQNPLKQPSRRSHSSVCACDDGEHCRYCRPRGLLGLFLRSADAVASR